MSGIVGEIRSTGYDSPAALLGYIGWMKRPHFTIYGLLNTTALVGTLIVVWKLVDAWLPFEFARVSAPEIATRNMWLRGINQALFMLAGVIIAGRLKYKQQYWWWPGAWMGILIGVALWIGIHIPAFLLSKFFQIR